jgi:DNA gyrase/topoisomerase IV subunit A
MTNENLADISAFESIQSNQNTRTEISQMSTFQTNTPIINSIDDATKTIDAVAEIVKGLKKICKDEEYLNKSFETVYRKAETILESEYKRIGDALKQNPNDNELLKENKKIVELYNKYNNLILQHDNYIYSHQ